MRTGWKVMNKKVAQQGVVPKIRFPGFVDGWAESPMSAMYSFLGNNSLSRDKLNYEIGSFRNIHYGDIHTKFAQHFRVDDESVPYINDGESQSAIKPENYCRVGDMVFADASEDTKDIGRAIEIMDAGNIPLVSGLHTILARPVRNSFAPGFGAYLFSSADVRKQIQRESQGAKVLGLSVGRLGTIQLCFPRQGEEQQKIADCLSSLDVCIGAETRKLDALKAHKQGLMQQLFPVEDERLPRLRFPGFAGRWKEVAAGALFSRRLESGEDGLPIYSVTMTDGMVLRSSVERRVDDIAESKGNRKVHKGDIAYNMMRMWQGACGVAPESCMVSPAYVILAPKPDACSNFFGYLLKLPQSLRQLTSHSQGLTQDRLRLYFKDFATIPLLCPERDEQQKIADCLLSADRMIAAQSHRIAGLRKHKKGLMQGLFPASVA